MPRWLRGRVYENARKFLPNFSAASVHDNEFRACAWNASLRASMERAPPTA